MEDYVSYEQAVKLKELGFDWDCDFVYYLMYHNHNKPVFQRYETTRDYEMEKYWYAPTLAQAQKWLREVKNIGVSVYIDFEGHYDSIKMTYWYEIYLFDGSFINADIGKTYEDALSAGIDKTLELLKEQENG